MDNDRDVVERVCARVLAFLYIQPPNQTNCPTTNNFPTSQPLTKPTAGKVIMDNGRDLIEMVCQSYDSSMDPVLQASVCDCVCVCVCVRARARACDVAALRRLCA